MDSKIKKESLNRKKPCRHCKHHFCDFRQCERWTSWFKSSYGSLREAFEVEKPALFTIADAAELIRRAQRL